MTTENTTTTAVATETATETAAKAEAKALCLCGCGETPAGKRGRFLPGHDGRLKGRLLAEARKGSAEAVVTLEKHGWSHFLVETVKAKNKRQAAERKAQREQAEAVAAAKAAGTEAPAEPEAPSSLTVEDKARIAAAKAAGAGKRGMRPMANKPELVAAS